MPNHFHAVIMNVGADLRVCPEPDTHPDAHEGEHIGSHLPTQTNTFAVSNCQTARLATLSGQIVAEKLL